MMLCLVILLPLNSQIQKSTPLSTPISLQWTLTAVDSGLSEVGAAISQLPQPRWDTFETCNLCPAELSFILQPMSLLTAYDYTLHI